MPGKYYSRMAAIAAFLSIFNAPPVVSQNRYPASGDALIHGLTIGTGNGAQISNTALGDSALFYNKGGINNTAAGSATLLHNSSGTDNTALGFQALYGNISGGYNLAAGSGALFGSNSGSYNVALGQGSLGMNTSGNYNSAIGVAALRLNTTGMGNTAFGSFEADSISSSSYNAAIGGDGLAFNTTGNYNTALGSVGVLPASTVSNTTTIGSAVTTGASNSVVFGGITSIGGYASWSNFSDGRYKKNVKRNVPGLSFINRLEPVTYTLDVDGIQSRSRAEKKYSNSVDGRTRANLPANPAIQENSRIVHTGFIAQDVEKTAQSLNYAFSGVDKPKDDQQSLYGLRYSDFVVPLVKAVQELSAENDSLKAANARLSLQLEQIEQLLGISYRQPKN